jgi:hypothetical protein
MYGQPGGKARAGAGNIALMRKNKFACSAALAEKSSAAPDPAGTFSKPFLPIFGAGPARCRNNSRVLTGTPLDCPNSALCEPPSHWSFKLLLNPSALDCDLNGTGAGRPGFHVGLKA